MTAKDKAVELVDKFTFNCRECDNGKLSALIAVDEIINIVNMCISYLNKETYIQYWIEVKKHIEKL